MIALVVAAAVVPDQTDFDAFKRAIEKCDRATVAGTIKGSVERHSRFLIDAYKEQRSIADARTDLAERRRKLHTGAQGSDTEAVLALAGEAISDRQRALDDQRTLDRLEQDMVVYFRQQYLSRCAGRTT